MEKKEELDIYSILDFSFANLSKYKSSQNVPFSLINIRGIVLHQLTEEKEDVINDIIPELIEKNENPYHFPNNNANLSISRGSFWDDFVEWCEDNFYTIFQNNFNNSVNAVHIGSSGTTT